MPKPKSYEQDEQNQQRLAGEPTQRGHEAHEERLRPVDADVAADHVGRGPEGQTADQQQEVEPLEESPVRPGHDENRHDDEWHNDGLGIDDQLSEEFEANLF